MVHFTMLKCIYLQFVGQWGLLQLFKELSGCLKWSCSFLPPSSFPTPVLQFFSSLSNIKPSQVLPGLFRLVLPSLALPRLALGLRFLRIALVLLLFESGQKPGDELVSRFVGSSAALLSFLLLAVSPLQPHISVGWREELVHWLKHWSGWGVGGELVIRENKCEVKTDYL